MAFFRKPTVARASSLPEERARAADQLRADVSALENDFAESTRVLADIETRAAAAETRAMKAIQAGDDEAARNYLVKLQAYAEKAAAVGAELKVLRAILDECDHFAKELSASPPSTSSD
jgi:phage shock protein A